MTTENNRPATPAQPSGVALSEAQISDAIRRVTHHPDISGNGTSLLTELRALLSTPAAASGGVPEPEHLWPGLNEFLNPKSQEQRVAELNQEIAQLQFAAPASSVPADRDAVLEEAATICDQHYTIRCGTGHPREASAARMLAKNIRALKGKPAAPAPCPNAAHMGEHACTNRSQCWEPCGELGKSREHAAPAAKRETDLSREIRTTLGGNITTTGKLILLLDRAAEEIERYYGGMLNWKATAEAKDRAPAAPITVPQWVSVDEQLPPEPVNRETVAYLLHWSDGEVASGWYDGDGAFMRANGEMDYHEESKVTHWRELPAAPAVPASEPKGEQDA